jgi:hypothetical protein
VKNLHHTACGCCVEILWKKTSSATKGWAVERLRVMLVPQDSAQVSSHISRAAYAYTRSSSCLLNAVGI